MTSNPQHTKKSAAELRPGDTVVRMGGILMRVDFLSRTPAQPRRFWRAAVPELVTVYSDPQQRDAADMGWFATSSRTAESLTYTADSTVSVLAGSG